jgi:hypothetical protein
MKYAILMTAMLLGAAGCSSQPAAQVGAPATRETKALPSGAFAPIHAASHAEAAAASLTTFAQLVSPQKSLGFASAEEVASATLAEPLPMYHVGLDALRAYRAGDDPRALLLDTGAVLYPLTVAGEARSSMVVHKVNGEWKATQFGRPTLAKHVHEGRAKVASARGVAESGVSYVDVPALSARMLRHDERGVPMLTALADLPGTNLRAGATLPAADVFAMLQPIAVAHDGSAPN